MSTGPDMKALVVWGGRLDVANERRRQDARWGRARFVLHAVVDGDLLTLCGELGAGQLLPVPPGPVQVCPLCVSITEQLAAGLLTLQPDRGADQ